MKKFLVLCCFVCGYAFSQIYETEGITVVGKRLYDGSLQTGYYGAAQVITSADIQAVGALTVPDVLQKYGIAKYHNGTGSPIAWTLNWNGFSKGQEIVVIVDGIKINEPDENDVYWQNIPVADIERIEIIQGAGSAQYGSGAFAGVLNIMTNKTPRKSVSAEIGSYGFGRQGFTLGDVFADNFYYNLNFDHLAGSGYRHKSTYSGQRLSGKLGYFTDNTELNLYYKKSESLAHYPVQLTEDELLFDRTKASIASRQNVNSDQTNLEYIKRLNDNWSYALNLGWQNRGAVLKNISKASNSFTGYQDDTEHAVSYLGQITYKDKLTFGYDYSVADIRSKGLNTDHKRTSDLAATKGTYAPYAQYFDRFGPVYVRYGVREDSVDFVQTNNFDKSAERKTKKFSSRAHNGELGWNFIPDWQVYYSYGEAFKAPTFYNLFVSDPVNWFYGNESLNPEIAKTQSAGLRWQNVYTNFSWNVFQTIVDDEIIGIMNQSYETINQNAQKTRRDGFNLNLTQKISAGLNVFANYGYTQARFVEGDAYGADLSGLIIPQVPEEVYALGFNYIYGQYTLDFSQNFVGQQYAADYISFANDWFDMLPAYNFADAKISYKPVDDVNIYLTVHNLFNNIYNTKSLAWWDSSDYKNKLVFTPADLRAAALGAQWSF
jgi:outer membrane cobalamin receptor